MEIELVTRAPAGSPSGIGRYVGELHRHLVGRTGVRFVCPVYPPFSTRFSLLRQFPLGIRDHQAGSLVHFTQIMGCAQMIWRPVRPALATVHDLGVLVCEEDEQLFNRLDRGILDLHLNGLRRMDYIVAVSEFTKHCVIEKLRFPAERVRTIYHGIDGGIFHPVPQARAWIARRYGIRGGNLARFVLYVGNELPRKNLAVLLKALVRLKREGRLLQLLKVSGAGGDRWRERFLAEVKRLQLEDVVIIVGPVPESDLPLFYSAADLYVTTSLIEGFGLPVLEAMACGAPVVCSDAGSLPEVAGDAAILVDPRDPDAVAGAMAEVLDDGVLAEGMRERGLSQANQFTWEESVERLCQVYRQLDG